MNQNEALEILAKHYYCPYTATVIDNRIVVQEDLMKAGKKNVRMLQFECEYCGAKWATLFEIED